MKKTKLLLLAALSGILLTLGWPEIGDITPLLFIAFIPLLMVEDELYQVSLSGAKRSPLLYSYITFFSWNLLTTWWIWYASAGGMVMAILLNAMFMTTIFQLFHITRKKVGSKEGYIGLIFYWIAWEYIHLSWELTWPWLTLGNGFANDVQFIQWYSITGTMGGSLWILVVNVLLFLGVKQLRYSKDEKRTWMLPIGIAAGIIIIPAILSSFTYSNYSEKENPVNIVVLQPNIDPYRDKFSGKTVEEQVETIIDLADSKLDENTQYVVAPETAIPSNIWEDQIKDSQSYQMLKDLTDKHPNLKVVIGMSSALVYKNETDKTVSARKFDDIDWWYDYFNTAIQVDQTDSLQLYHKSKLVPGVERMPYPGIFRPLEALAIPLGGGPVGSLGTQEERGVFLSPDHTIGVAPVICYESVYGEFVSDYVNNGAELIFIITNDGWWEDTPGYKQHMAYGRLRAIETRRSIARSANTGISCFINQRGDVSQPTSWWVEAAIKETINANDELTFYTRYGDLIARVALFVSSLLLLLTLVRKFVPKK